MALVKRLLTFVLVGLLVGAAIATGIATRVLSWYQEPGTGQALCACGELARSTLSSLVYWQLVGGIIGGVTFLIVGIVLSFRRRAGTGKGGGADKAAAPPAVPSTTAPPSSTPPTILPPPA